MNYCNTCAYLIPNQNICALTHQQKNPDKDYCSEHRKELTLCETCKNPVIKPILTSFNPEDTKYFSLCAKCNEASGSCSLCAYGQKCEFEQNPSPTPKQIVKTIRQGNSVMQTTIPNPERIRELCAGKCKCYNEEFHCNRQFNCCANQLFILLED